MKIAFIITVYKNDKLEYFKQAVDSIVKQDYGFENINIYLGIDGDIPVDIEKYINENKNLFFKIIKNSKNNGLAYTLNRLIDVLEDEKYVFRMDSDDICKFYRVSKQIEFLETNKDILILGGSIEEIDENNNIKMIRTYPQNYIKAIEMIPKASIFAHPAVCFRKEFFDMGFRYNEKYKFNQDLALWFDALSKQILISNLDDIILSLRVSSDFYKRRNYKRSLSEFVIYFSGIKKLYGYNWRMIYPVIRLFIRFLPSFFIKFIYSCKIRKILNYNKEKEK